MESWIFLIVGSVGALGAAMTLGTLGALVAYRRTGEMPGAAADAPPPTPLAIRLLWLRAGLGAVLAAIAVAVLQGQDLL